MKIRRQNWKAAAVSVLVLAGAVLLTAFSGREPAEGRNADADADTEVSGFEQIEQSPPVRLPAAAQYPKPMFDGTVTQVDPAWSTASVIPEDRPHIDPNNAQSLPVKDFTITQCWKGGIHGKPFVLQTYCNFDLSKENRAGGGDCYVALKLGEKVSVASVDRFETLVNFCGPMAVFIRNAMSYPAWAIDLRNGNEVEAGSDEMASLACAQPFDLSHPPVIPSHVMGIPRQIAVYPVSQTSASVSNPFNNPKDASSWTEAWEHRIGNQ